MTRSPLKLSSPGKYRSFLWIWACVLTVLGFLVLVGTPWTLHIQEEQILHEEGHSFAIKLDIPKPFLISSDAPLQDASNLEVMEDGNRLGPAHTQLERIQNFGRGRYLHLEPQLHFSTWDNTDPRGNGRTYSALVWMRLPPSVLTWAVLGVSLATLLLGITWWRQRLLPFFLLVLPPTLWIALVGFSTWVTTSQGPRLWMLTGLTGLLVVWAFATTGALLDRGFGSGPRPLHRAQISTLALISLTLSLCVAEAYLLHRENQLTIASALQESSKTTATADGPPPDALNREVSLLEERLESFGVSVPESMLLHSSRRAKYKTMPPHLEVQPIEIEGAARAKVWHGVLHVYDRHHMRRTEPFPTREEDTLRLMIVGDSLTYGSGIAEEWTYSRQLERLLEVDYRVEVLNLGVEGLQSENILERTRDLLPLLQPDLVFYGVCPNDFLPAGVGQYQRNEAYSVPIPKPVKDNLAERSRIVQLAQDGYADLLVRFGLRRNFKGDILDGFSGYQRRFEFDVRELSATVQRQGIPPIVAMVLDQNPSRGGQSHEIGIRAEQILRAAGIEVIESAPYYAQFDQRSFRVSRWEGHPNEIANAIWASMIDRHLRRNRTLAAYRIRQEAEEPSQSSNAPLPARDTGSTLAIQ